MNGIHDMGGMTCFGPIVREENEPTFHTPWERRVFAMTMLGMGRFDTLDGFRHAIERMDPAHYLESSYYEHWLAALETLAVEKGALSAEELRSGVATTRLPNTEPPLPPEAVSVVVSRGAPCDRHTGRMRPRFQVGDRVLAKNINPAGHTRLPRYVRGKQGVIHLVHGTFVYPDTNAHGGGERPQPVYSVRFSARELWGPAAARRDHLHIDLWEDYLELLGTAPTTIKAATTARKARLQPIKQEKTKSTRKVAAAQRPAKKQRANTAAKGKAARS